MLNYTEGIHMLRALLCHEIVIYFMARLFFAAEMGRSLDIYHKMRILETSLKC